MIESIASLQDEMTRWRRDIHAHPELGFEENRTAGIVADKLRGFGMEVHTCIGKTGGVGVLRNGSSTRAVGLRGQIPNMTSIDLRPADIAERLVPGHWEGDHGGLWRHPATL